VSPLQGMKMSRKRVGILSKAVLLFGFAAMCFVFHKITCRRLFYQTTEHPDIWATNNLSTNQSLFKPFMGQTRKIELGIQCTSKQIEIMSSMNPVETSNCPSYGSWYQVLLNDSAKEDVHPTVVMSIGCNKGNDFIAAMRDWSGNRTFSPENYESASERKFGKLPTACTLMRTPLSPLKKKRPIRGFCVEPMPSNYRLLEAMMIEMKYIGPVKLIQAAVSSVAGVAPFPDGAAGDEASGLDVPSNTRTLLVNVTTIDDIIWQEKIEVIDMLSIDTEGNDMRTIIGGIKTLSTLHVRFVAFEYHQVGRWSVSDLQDLIDIFDHLNFDCYWTLNSGKLCRLTGCWHSSYSAKRRWSNVACVNRRNNLKSRALKFRS